ncbi:MAG: hypothetical protein M1827_000835 [Pycnora praestabilis]|nr:MAG: hypothetical protein M1827_000835 [Pycnora praestabilis]
MTFKLNKFFDLLRKNKEEEQRTVARQAQSPDAERADNPQADTLRPLKGKNVTKQRTMRKTGPRVTEWTSKGWWRHIMGRSHAPLQTLPAELFNQILDLLDDPSIAILRLVCKDFYNFFEPPSFLKPKDPMEKCKALIYLDCLEASQLAPASTWKHYPDGSRSKEAFICIFCKDYRPFKDFPWHADVRNISLDLRYANEFVCRNHPTVFNVKDIFQSMLFLDRFAIRRGWSKSLWALCLHCKGYEQLDAYDGQQCKKCGCNYCEVRSYDLWTKTSRNGLQRRVMRYRGRL